MWQFALLLSVTVSFGRCGGGSCTVHAYWPAKWETSLVNLPLASTGQGSSPPATVTPAGSQGLSSHT